MITWSMFTAYLGKEGIRAPYSVVRQVRREALARLHARQAAGYADGPLLFDDLVQRVEDSISSS